MKKLILLALISLNSFAYTDYECHLRSYRVQLSIDGKSTHIWLYEGYNFVGQNYIAHTEDLGEKTSLVFYLGEGPAKLTFKKSDLASPPETLVGWIDAKANGWIIWDKLTCSKLD